MIERSQEYRRIKRVSGWPNLAVSPKVFYLIDSDGGKDAGVWVFHPQHNALQVHVAMDRRHRGKYAVASARAAFAWIFEHTDCELIVAEIPDEYRYVHFMARHVGMTLTGIDEDDRRCYRLDKPHFEQRAA